ncbi:MAG: hypothetical protein M3N35_10160 [Candidatus Binatota bacterium]|nr:hypothetical protein [Candidatus Binatota bacterium]
MGIEAQRAVLNRITIAPQLTLLLRSSVLAYLYNTTIAGAIMSIGSLSMGVVRDRRQSLGIGEIMKVADSIRRLVRVPKLTATRMGLSAILLITMVSGCGSVIANSESFYQNMPRRPINWNEYLMN